MEAYWREWELSSTMLASVLLLKDSLSFGSVKISPTDVAVYIVIQQFENIGQNIKIRRLPSMFWTTQGWNGWICVWTRWPPVAYSNLNRSVNLLVTICDVWPLTQKCLPTRGLSVVSGSQGTSRKLQSKKPDHQNLQYGTESVGNRK